MLSPRTLFDTSLGTTLPLSECVLDTDALRSSFGGELPFVSLDLRCPEFISALRLTHEFDLEFALRQLRRMRDHNSADFPLATKLYKLVGITVGTHIAEVREVFSGERLILVSSRESQFALSSEVCWSSYPPPLDKRKLPIGRLYPELGSFFLEGIAVDRELQPHELATAVEELVPRLLRKRTRPNSIYPCNVLHHFRSFETHFDSTRVDPAAGKMAARGKREPSPA